MFPIPIEGKDLISHITLNYLSLIVYYAQNSMCE